MTGQDKSAPVGVGRVERRRRFLLDWFNGETVNFCDRDGSWTIRDLLSEMDWQPLEALSQAANARLSPRGAPTKFAKDHGLCDETVFSFLRGGRPPSEALLTALGWERRCFYRPIQPLETPHAR